MPPVHARFTKKRFLEYHHFKDEPESVPQIFLRDKGSYEKLISQVEKDVKIGLKVVDAIRLNAGISLQLAYKWQRDFFQELQDGKTDTPLIRLFVPALRADADIYRKIMTLALNKAEEGDVSTIQYLAKHRLGYGKPQTSVNVDNSENNNIQITISDMKSIESDIIDVNSEEVLETKELEGNNDEYQSGDDSDPAEMD